MDWFFRDAWNASDGEANLRRGIGLGRCQGRVVCQLRTRTLFGVAFRQTGLDLLGNKSSERRLGVRS